MQEKCSVNFINTLIIVFLILSYFRKMLLLNLKLVIRTPEMFTTVSKHGSWREYCHWSCCWTFKHHSNTLLNIHSQNFYLIIDGGGDFTVTNLSVQIALLTLFIKHDMDEIIACHASAWLLYRIPLERVYSNANLGLKSIGLMRLVMDPDKKGWLKT